jgi:predicted small metal-binding protein
MFTVSCKDLGIDCDYVAEARKLSKAEYEMIGHMREEHPEMIAGLTDVQHKELETRIKSAVREAA